MRRFEMAQPARSARVPRFALPPSRIVLAVAALQLVVGLCLLGVVEGYKVSFFNSYIEDAAARQRGEAGKDSPPPGAAMLANPMDVRSPMGFCFWVAVVNNFFAIVGLAGVLNASRELVVGFFVYNAAAMVLIFHIFVDVMADTRISYRGEPPQLTAYEKAAAFFLFFNMVLAAIATSCAIKAIDDIRLKQREEYNRLTVLGDTLAFEADQP